MPAVQPVTAPELWDHTRPTPRRFLSEATATGASGVAGGREYGAALNVTVSGASSSLLRSWVVFTS